MSKFTKPIIKWVGGKTQILELLLNKFPKKMNNYHEIFIGGGSVLLGLLELKKNKTIKVNNIFAYDYNEHLINLYKCIKENPEKLYNEIIKLANIYNSCVEIKGNKKPETFEEAKLSKESYFYWLRKEFNKNKEDLYYQSALFVFINKTCFRGMYRTGPNGFNVPFGHYKKPTIINKEHLLYISELIKDVKFIRLDFNESMKNIKNNDFTYLDPPYYPTNPKSFVKYNKKGFNVDNHNQLFKNCKELYKNKNKFIMSNSSAQFVIDYFKDICKINIVDCKRRINSKKPNSTAKEVIISNFD
jgi:DNA adenine methylase